jgi:hypothetical protein
VIPLTGFFPETIDNPIIEILLTLTEEEEIPELAEVLEIFEIPDLAGPPTGATSPQTSNRIVTAMVFVMLAAMPIAAVFLKRKRII